MSKTAAICIAVVDWPSDIQYKQNIKSSGTKSNWDSCI